MKTIFRFVNLGIMLAVVIAVGTLAGFAQDPAATPTPDPACADAEGKAAVYKNFLDNYKGDVAGRKAAADAKKDFDGTKDQPQRKVAIAAGNEYLKKYGACPVTPDAADPYVPYLQKKVPLMEAEITRENLIGRFNAGLNSKNWDDVYSAGKELLAKFPDEFRAAELVLGSIGLDETAKAVRVTKWNEDTLRYAKMSIADLEAGKTFKSYGVPPFTYKDKDDAIAWMNYTIGYIYFFDKKNKKDGISYIYKASQLNSATKTNPVVFESIGAFYFDDVAILANEVKVLIDGQMITDTPEVAQQKVDAIKAKVGMVNGTAERALDAYARAFKLADPVKDKAYREVQRATMLKIYSVRYGKEKLDGFDAWLNAFTPKQLVDPLSKITPINDPEPAAPVTTTTTTTSTPGPIKPPVTTPVKPPVTTPAKTPVSTKSPATAKVVVKKPVVKKRKVT